MTGLNFEYRGLIWFYFLGEEVAALSFPNKIFLASLKVMSFTALTKIGVASFTASSAARFKSFKPSSARST